MSTETKIKFIVGESYSRRSICDYDCVFCIKIVSRTEKTVMAEDSFGETRRYKIQNYGNYEYIKAGNYSMAGTWSAESICKEEAPEDAPVTPEELAEAFTGEELSFIRDTLEDTMQGSYEIPDEELPDTCIPFRRKVA